MNKNWEQYRTALRFYYFARYPRQGKYPDTSTHHLDTCLLAQAIVSLTHPQAPASAGDVSRCFAAGVVGIVAFVGFGSSGHDRFMLILFLGSVKEC